MLKIIGTHNGVFHADEVMAYAILSLVFPSINLIRSRDPKLLAEADILIDVGGGEFDHHQAGFSTKRENDVLYPTAGLVWKAYGKEAIMNTTSSFVDDKGVNNIFCSIDKGLIEPIDRHDNGDFPLTQEYMSYGFSGIISSFNSRDGDEDYNFNEAVQLAEDILISRILSLEKVQNAKEVVKAAVANAKNGIMVLENFVPWQSHMPKSSDIFYVIFPDVNGSWRVVCNREIIDEVFKEKKKFPESWAGLKDDEFQKHIGVPDAIFCHNGLFIAGARSKESVMKLAELALFA